MKKRNAILIFILVIALATFSGCNKNKANINDPTTTEPTTEGTTDTTGTTDTATPATPTFEYSKGIDENGFWENVKALDLVTLTQYKGLTIPKDIHTITDEAVQTKVDEILGNYSSTNQIKDRAIVDGDTVNIDYVGSVGGVEFAGGNTNGAGTDVTIGVTSYIDDFLQQLIGHTPGESFDVNVTFPENYGDETLNGKDAVFAVTINYISEKVIPELTDDFVATNLSTNYGWTTVQGMKDSIKEELQKTAISYYIQDAIVANSTVSTLPESILTYQKDSFVNYYESAAASYGMDLATFLTTYVGYPDMDSLMAVATEDITKTANYYLIVQAVAEDAGITATRDDITAYFSKNMGTEDYSQYETQYGLPYLMLSVLHEKVLTYIEDNAVLE